MIESIPHIGEILAVGAALCWAIGVILFKRSGETMPPLTLNLFKGLVGLAFLTPSIIVVGGDLLPDVPWTTWALLSLSGFMGISLADTMFFISLTKLGAGLTAVVNTAYAPIVVALSFVWLGERLDGLDLAGAALIVSGLLVGSAARPPADKTRRDLLMGGLIGIGGLVIMGVSIVMVKPLLDELPVLWSTWVRLVAGSCGIVPLMLLHPDRRKLFWELRPNATWSWAVPGSFLGTYLAMSCWIGGMKYTEVSRAALLNQLSAIFLFALATVVLHEPLTWRRSLAVGLAAAGATLIVL